MKPNTRIAIAQLLSAAGSVLTAFAAEFGDGAAPQETNATPDPANDTEKPRRGRKPAAAAPAVTEPAQPETPAEQPAAPAVTGKTYEDMKELIRPLVEAERGAEVKAEIAKLAPSLREMKPEDYPAFERAINALSM